MPQLFVAMYRQGGNYEHWALYLDHSPDRGMIYEVIGDNPDFRTNVFSGNPRSTVRHQRNILMYDIEDVDIPAFRNAIAAVEPDNSIILWNCQDYVIEVLEKLEEEFIIDGDDEDYISAKEEVMEYFGPT